MLNQEFVTKHFKKIELAMLFGTIMFFVGLFTSNDYIANVAIAVTLLIGFVTLVIINGPSLVETYKTEVAHLESLLSKKDN